MHSSSSGRRLSLALLCGIVLAAGCDEEKQVDLRITVDGRPATCADIGNPTIGIYAVPMGADPGYGVQAPYTFGRCDNGPFSFGLIHDGVYEARVTMDCEGEGCLVGDLFGDGAHYAPGVLDLSTGNATDELELDLATIHLSWTGGGDEWFDCTSELGGLWASIATDPRREYVVDKDLRCTDGAGEIIAPVHDYELTLHAGWIVPVSKRVHVELGEHGADVGPVQLESWPDE